MALLNEGTALASAPNSGQAYHDLRPTRTALRILHTLASVADPAAGPSRSVTALCRAIAAHGHAVSIETVAGWRTSSATGDIREIAGVPVVKHPQTWAAVPTLRGLCASSGLRARVVDGEPRPDIIHAHGLWLLPNQYPAIAARKRSTAVVHSIRGMLGANALAFSASKKRIAWFLFQRRALAAAACLHATGLAERDEIRAADLFNPVAIIPNGVDLPDLDSMPRANSHERTVLSLGRIHPKKGLDRLIRAWALLYAEFPEWRLRIVGPAELGHDAELRAIAAALGAERVAIEPPLYNEAKLAAYRGADLFVLPTLNENFALTVAEALAAGAPVIATKGAPWSGLEAERCGWWIDHGVEPLATALRRAMAMPQSHLAAIGARGRAWMERDFSWDSIAHRMISVYHWVCGKGARPSCVVHD